MSNREKIIVIMASVAVLYGMYEYLFSAKPGVPQKNAEDKEDTGLYISRISQELVKANLTPLKKCFIEKTEKKWEDVFIPAPLPAPEDESGEELQNIKPPVYTGYLEMENRIMAIIDGMEYVTGDFLPGSGYELILISPEEITVRNKKKELLPIPIAEDDVADYENARKK